MSSSTGLAAWFLPVATCPFRGIKRWSWETYWLLQGLFSWILASILIATALVLHLFSILHTAPTSSLFFSYFSGFMWGFGALTFGLSIRYLGIALGYPIALGLCTVFGTLMPPIFSGEIGTILRQTPGQFILIGIAVRAWHHLQRTGRALQRNESSPTR